MNFLPQKTIHYKTYIKTAVTEAFREVFSHHVDEILGRTKVTIEFPRTESEYPSLLIRFFERDIQNAGVGHVEHIHADGPDGKDLETGTYAFKHFLYHGTLEYVIYGLSSLDRDYISDSVVQTLAMGDLEAYTNRFFERIYPNEEDAQYPDSIWHFININTDLISGGQDTQVATPWQSEDDLIYQTSYRTPVFGSFYSVPPDLPKGYIEKVVTYPYIGGIEPIPQGNIGDEGLWQPPLGT